MAVQAIIFDCFGVLCTDGWLPFKDKYFGNNADSMRQATDLNQQANAGLLSYNDFLARIAELAGISKSDACQAVEYNVPDTQLFDYIKTWLKPHYKIGLLSNASVNWLDKLFTPQQVGLLDAVSLSCDTGFTKPDARAFASITDKFGLVPADCIFIDDQERFVTAGREVGMQAIWHEDFKTTRAELEALL